MGMAFQNGDTAGPPLPTPLAPVQKEPVALGLLVQRATSDAFRTLQELCRTLPGQGEKERKLALLKYLVKTRQRLLRLHALADWAKQAPLVSKGQQLSGTLEWHDTSFRDAADQLYFLHAQLQQARAPPYDVATALEVLTTGTYSRLPTVIQDLRPPPSVSPSEEALAKADRLIRARLLDCELPPQLREVHVHNGAVRMQVKDEFEVRLTLGSQGDLSKWRILWLSLGANNEKKEGSRGLTQPQRVALARELERRMGLAPDPLQEMYRVLHELSANLVLDSVFRQARSLKQGAWRDIIRLHFAKTDGQDVFTSLKIEYWDRQAPSSVNRFKSASVSVDPFRMSPSVRLTPSSEAAVHLERGENALGLKGPPSLKIELDEDRHVSCSHWPVVVDPETEESATFSLSADLERLLEKAITCSAHSKLLEIEAAIGKEPQLCCHRSEQTPNLEGGPETGQNQGGVEKLWVRVYGNVDIGVEVDRKNGRFVLRQPVGLLLDVRLQQLEERLNSGAEVASVFLELRKAALLRMFQGIAAEMGLQALAQGVASVQMPSASGPPLSADALLFTFPSGFENSTFYLALSLDTWFIPRFTLLASDQKDGAEEKKELVGTSLTARPKITRWLSIAVEDSVIEGSEPAASLLGRGFENERATAIAEDVQLREEREAAERKKEQTLVAVASELGMTEKWREERSLSSGFLRSSSEKRKSEEPLALLKEWPDTDEMDGDWKDAARNLRGSSAEGGSNVMAEGSRAQGPPRLQKSSFERSLTMDMVEGLLDMLSDPEKEQADLLGATGTDDRTGGLEIWDSTAGQESKGLDGESQAAVEIAKAALEGIGQEEQTEGAGPSSLDFKDASLDGNLETATVGKKRQRESSPDVGAASLQMGGQELGVNEGGGEEKSKAEEPATKKQKLENSLPSGLTDNRGTSSDVSLSVNVAEGRGEAHKEELVREKQEQEGPNMGDSAQEEKPKLDSQDAMMREDQRPETVQSQDQGAPSEVQTADQQTPEKGDVAEIALGTEKLEAACESAEPMALVTTDSPQTECTLAVGRRFSSLLAAANQGQGPVGVYRAALYKALEHSRLCIKHELILRQMTSAGIALAEEVGFRRPSMDLRIKVPFLGGGDDVAPPWPSIRVLMGGFGVPGVSVAVEDSYFKSLASLACRQAEKKSRQDRGEVEHEMQIGAQNIDIESLALEASKPSELWSRDDLHYLESQDEDSHLLCTLKGLKIAVKRITPFFAREITGDLKRVWLARAFTLHLAEALGVLPDRQKRSSSEAFGEFTIVGIGLTDIELRYDGFRTVLVSVTWPRGSEGAKVALLPEGLGRLEKHLKEFVDEGEVTLLLDAVRIAAVPQGLLAESLPSAGPTKRVIYAPDEVRLRLLSPYKARFTFRDCFTFEMRCFDGGHVWLQPVPPADPHLPKGFAQIPGFQWIVNESLAAAQSQMNQGKGFDANDGLEEGLGEGSGKLGRFRSFKGSADLQTFPSFNRQASSGHGDGDVLTSPGSAASGAVKMAPSLATYPGGRPRLTDTGGYAGMWVPWYGIQRVCRGLWPNLAVHWAVIAFVECVQETKELLTVDNEWQILKLDMGRPLLQLKFGNLAVQLSASSNTLKLKVLLVGSQEGPITKADTAELEEYFHIRVLRSPQHRDRVASFVNLLALPTKTLRDFVGLIRWEKAQRETATSMTAELCLEKKPLPPGVTEHVEPLSLPERDPSAAANLRTKRIEGNVYYDRRKGTVDFALGFKCPVGSNPAPLQAADVPGSESPTPDEAPFVLAWLRSSVQDESIQLWDLQGALNEAMKERLVGLLRTALELNTRGESERTKMQRAADAIQATLLSSQ